MNKYIPICFVSLNMMQLQNIESNAIIRGNNEVRFKLLKAGKGSESDQKWIMGVVKDDPTWIEKT